MEDMRLIFFTDGANCIRENISRYFAFREHTIILDWLHLKKKCKELVCSSIAGTKEDRNEVHKTLMAMLWAGNADNAMEYIAELPEKSVRNKGMLAELKGYIERKSPYMACYAMRHELGLRISSNRVERRTTSLWHLGRSTTAWLGLSKEARHWLLLSLRHETGNSINGLGRNQYLSPWQQHDASNRTGRIIFCNILIFTLSLKQFFSTCTVGIRSVKKV